VNARELLFQFTGQSDLDFVESLELRNRDKDDDSLLAALDFDFSCSRDLKRTKFALQVVDIVLQVNQSLADEQLSLGRWDSGGIGRTDDFTCSRHL